MTTATDIVNLALDVLDEVSIGDIAEDTKVGRWASRNFRVKRRAFLEMSDWDFARRRASLAAKTAKPAFGWEYAYGLPGDTVRLLPVTDDGSLTGRVIKHEREGFDLLCNKQGPLNIRYIADDESYGRWPASAVEALASSLAMSLSHWLTGKSGYFEIAANMHRDALNRAMLMNALQGGEPEPEASTLVDSRYEYTW